MKRCDKCSTENPDNAKYCRNCGYELPKPQEPIVDETLSNAKQTGKSNSKKSIGFYSIGVTVFIAASLIVNFILKKSTESSLDKNLVEIVNELNKSLPMMIDNETLLQNTITLPEKILQYNYILINVDKDTDLDTLEAKNRLEPPIINNYQTNPQMQYMRDNKVTLNYCYKDKSGNYLFMISVKPEH